MTRSLPFALLLVATLALVGCNKNKDNSVADPAADAGMADPDFAPVEITPGSSAGYVEPAPMSSAPAMGGNSYTVQKGDTLWSIARKHYGNGQKWQDIVAANPGLDPQKLPVGKTITLP